MNQHSGALDVGPGEPVGGFGLGPKRLSSGSADIQPWEPTRPEDSGLGKNLGRLEFLFSGLEQSFADADRLLELDKDWDGEGADPFSRETIERTKRFLSFAAARAPHRRLNPPSVLPAASGSVDLYWRSKTRTFLLNIPANATQPATYYGQTDDRNTTSGVVDPDGDRPMDLLAWILS